MTYYIVGLGNPGDEYEMTRHNAGRILVEALREKNNFPEWKKQTQKGCLVSKGTVGKNTVVLVLPELFMNKSGVAIKSLITSAKVAERLVVVHDDIDLGLGTCRISFGRGSGGHRGVESIIKSIKTKDFIRVRVGVSPTTASGKIRKPKGEDAVLDFLLKDFSKKEHEELSKIKHTVNDTVVAILTDGYATAMNTYN